MQKNSKIKWLDWLNAYGHEKLAAEIGVAAKAPYNWSRGVNLPKDTLKRKIVEISNGVIDFNSFFEV